MFRPSAIGSLLVLVQTLAVSADGIGVLPMRVEVTDPAKTGEVTIRNSGDDAVTVQVRVFKWELINGKSSYTEAADIVAVPPIAAVAGKSDLVARIVRLAPGPIQGVESYRIAVDQLPAIEDKVRSGISVLVRFTVPTYFVARDASPPQLAWSVRVIDGVRSLVAENTGDRPTRLKGLRLGRSSLVKGVAGDVLGHSWLAWKLPPRVNDTHVHAESETGAVDGTISP